MLLYLLRHGIAEDHGSRSSDAERELTEEGKIKTHAALSAARKMKLAAPELVIASPLVRAQQTAEIAMEVFARGAAFETSDTVTPMADITETMSLIADRSKKYRSVMLVGHDPHLSSLGSALLGNTSIVIEMKKASLAKFEISRFDVPRMSGHLVALLPPKIGSI
jgi:phosphohistidine phosphatase